VVKPTIPDDVEGHRRIVRDGGLPIATGENLHTLYEFKQMIVSGAVTFPEADVTNCGGVTAFLKIAHMAEAINLPITSHGAHDITIHLLAALPNRSYLEVHGFGLERFLMSINVRYSAADGLLPGSTKPQARRQGPHRMSPGPGRRGGRWDQSGGSAQRRTPSCTWIPVDGGYTASDGLQGSVLAGARRHLQDAAPTKEWELSNPTETRGPLTTDPLD
jgi:hypothetical protein